MLRDAIVSIFTVALIALGAFLLDIFKGIISGNWEGILSGILASIVGIIVALAVLISSGWWLIRDDKARRSEESKRHSELIDAIKDNKEILDAIRQILLKDNNKDENNQD